jgi:hypothetical protein
LKKKKKTEKREGLFRFIVLEVSVMDGLLTITAFGPVARLHIMVRRA